MVRKSLFFLLMITAFALVQLYYSQQAIVEEIGSIDEYYTKAKSAYDTFNFSDALPPLSKLITILKEKQSSGRLLDRDEVLLTKALELRGISNFNLGQEEAARLDLIDLIQLKPEFSFTLNVPSKIERFLATIRDSMTSSISLMLYPDDSEISIDGRQIEKGKTTIPLLKGPHVVKVNHSGFEGQSKEVDVEIGKVQSLEFHLSPNSRSIAFFTQPSDISIFINGYEMGKTGKLCSEDPSFSDFVKSHNLKPEETYAGVIQYLPPGEKKVSLRKACYERKDFVLNVVLDRERNSLGLINPVVLNKKSTDLTINSRPNGANIIIDDKPMGTTPITINNFCVGDHSFILKKEGIGIFSQVLSVSSVSSQSLMLPLRPTLLFAGVSSAGQKGSSKGVAEQIEELLNDCALFNLAGRKKSDNDADLLCQPFTGGLGGEIAKRVGDIFAESKTDILLVARVAGEEMTLRLFTRYLIEPEDFTFTFPFKDGLKSFFDDLNHLLQFWKRGISLSAIDIPGTEAPILLRNEPPLMSGDGILRISSKIITRAEQVRWIDEMSGKIQVAVRRGGQEINLDVPTADKIELLPVKRSNLQYQAYLAWSYQAEKNAEIAMMKDGAVLNRAIIFLHFGKYDDVIKAADSVTTSELVPSAKLIKSMALIEMGKKAEADTILEGLAGDKEAIYPFEGGISISPLAIYLIKEPVSSKH